MKANGNSLIVPNVVKGQCWSADEVKAISPLYPSITTPHGQ